jgi:hypothetical protein
LDEDFDSQAPGSPKDGVFAIDTLKCKITCGVIVGVHTGVYVSLSNIMQKILPSSRCEPVETPNLDNTAEANGMVVNARFQV